MAYYISAKVMSDGKLRTIKVKERFENRADAVKEGKKLLVALKDAGLPTSNGFILHNLSRHRDIVMFGQKERKITYTANAYIKYESVDIPGAALGSLIEAKQNPTQDLKGALKFLIKNWNPRWTFVSLLASSSNLSSQYIGDLLRVKQGEKYIFIWHPYAEWKRKYRAPLQVSATGQLGKTANVTIPASSTYRYVVDRGERGAWAAEAYMNRY